MMKSNLISLILINYPILMNIIILTFILLPMKSNYHPMNLMIILIILTFMIALNMNLYFNSWMNFILIMIMIGGLMIIFMYITSLSNNKLFMFNIKTIMLHFLKYLMLLMMILIFMNWLFKIQLYINFQELWKLSFNLTEKKFEMSFNELFNFNKNPMLFIMTYLYYSMICIMNICYKSNMPLRQSYFYE